MTSPPPYLARSLPDPLPPFFHSLPLLSSLSVRCAPSAPGRGRPVRQCSGEAPAARHGTGASKWSVSNTNMCNPVGLKATKHYFRHRFFSISNTSKGTVFGGGPGCPPRRPNTSKGTVFAGGFFPRQTTGSRPWRPPALARPGGSENCPFQTLEHQQRSNLDVNRPDSC